MKYVAFFLLSLLVVVSFAPASVAQIRLNEILADPGTDWNGDGTVDSKLDEWVEIVNTSVSQVDRRSTVFRRGCGDRVSLRPSGMIGPGEVKV
jgi:hypothetical protein